MKPRKKKPIIHVLVPNRSPNRARTFSQPSAEELEKYAKDRPLRRPIWLPGGVAATDVRVTPTELTVNLADGRSLSVPLSWFPRLQHGNRAERKNWQIFGQGTAIEWPDLDEHIGVDGLLAGRRSSESKKSLARWLAGRRK